MALVKCKECGREISTVAEACPNCGYKAPKTSGCAQLVVAGIIGFVALVAIGQCSRSLSETESSPAPSPPAEPASSVDAAPSSTAVQASPPPAQTVGEQWTYDHDEDQMSKGTVHHAYVLSSNTVDFDFPYAGDQHGSLQLRKDPRHGLNVMFAIEKGQILCNSFEDCTVLVRFDDKEAARYSGIGPADNSTDVVFIQNEARFMREMKKAKRVRIAVDIYQQGAPVFDFDVSNFDSMKFDPSSASPASAAQRTSSVDVTPASPPSHPDSDGGS